MLEEATVTCPACWQEVNLELDLSAGSADYTEDCPVCCQPMAVHLQVDEETGEFEVSVESEAG